MLSTKVRFRRACASLLACACLLVAPSAPAQNQTPTTTPQPGPAQDREEVIRVSTELVQTDVTVFDRAGKFVDGLKAEDFELKVDGKPQQIAFFERVRAGSIDEDAQLRAARGGSGGRAAGPGAVESKVRPLDRGRTIFFFFDDLHLSLDSMVRARKTLLNFLDEKMGQNDEAAVMSATGQLGFLQQLTSDKAVLRMAVERLKPRHYVVTDNERPRMTEAHALAVEQNNQNVIEYFVQMLLRDQPQLPPDLARNMIAMRARNIMSQSNNITRQTLATLEYFVRGASPLPGRKIVFFFSDGFMIDQRTGDTRDRLRRLTDAAARAGVVVYTLDARGLTPGNTDATTEGNYDPSMLLVGSDLDDVRLTQEPLRALAGDTGGRAILNTNALDVALGKSVEEMSVYYLLAWRPEEGGGRGEKFRRIELRVKQRPELKVQARRGFYLTPPVAGDERADARRAKETATPPRVSAPDARLYETLTAAYRRDSLPTSLALAYLNLPNNAMLLTASVELDDAYLGYREVNGQKRALADLAGVVFDSSGKVVTSLKQELQIVPPSVESRSRARIVQSYQIPIQPGLYQVRFAARDRESGRLGSVWHWIEIPDPRKKTFSMSSLFVSERVPTDPPKDAAMKIDPLTHGVNVTADRRFSRTSWLRFLTFIYNASRPAGSTSDVVLQIQVFRDDQPVVTVPLRKIETENVEDTARIPYAAEIPLDTLPVGHYVLQVTVIDRTAKATASQRVNFSVE